MTRTYYKVRGCGVGDEIVIYKNEETDLFHISLGDRCGSHSMTLTNSDMERLIELLKECKGDS